MRSSVEKTRFEANYVPFDEEKWLAHRASDRFYRSLFNFNMSPIVESLVDEVGVLMALSVCIIVWNGLLIEGFSDFSGLHHEALLAANPLVPNFKLTLPIEPSLIGGGPLGFLLVFRNDASFARYRSAFHLWENILAKLSNMLLMASNASADKHQVRNLGVASYVLCRTLQHQLSGLNDPTERYEQDVKHMLPTQQQADALLTARNKLYRAQYDIHRAIEPFTDEITMLDKRTLINTVNEVAAACIECERLYKTPVPLLYTGHTLKFLTFWMTSLPFALYDVFASSWNHIGLVPGVAIMAFLFFGIEEIAVSLEEPFSILPLDEFVEEFQESIEDVMEWMTISENEKDDESLEAVERGAAAADETVEKQSSEETVPVNGKK